MLLAVALAALLAAACGSSATPAPTASHAASGQTSLLPGQTESSASAGSPTPVPTPRWRPAVGDTFQIQYEGPIDTSVDASLYDLDGDETAASTITALHARGRHVLCYVDAGAWESYRADASSFPGSVLGDAVPGWPQERWLDIRQIDTLAPILRHRLDTCASKGFDGLDPDNVDGYENSTGFPLTAADQLRFNRWLADEAHARGLAVALKNDGGQVADLVSVFDAAVVEDCVALRECAQYSPFVAAGKPVFDIEYNRPPSAFCPVAASLQFEIIGKELDLSVYISTCHD
jgi:hypothetical protein